MVVTFIQTIEFTGDKETFEQQLDRIGGVPEPRRRR